MLVIKNLHCGLGGEKMIQIEVLGIVWGCLSLGRLRRLGLTWLSLIWPRLAQISFARPSLAGLVSRSTQPGSGLDCARPGSIRFGLLLPSSA